MTELQHADAFFFITAIAVVFVSLGMLVALYYLNLILRDIHLMVRKVRKASDEIEQDFEEARATIRNEGERVRAVFEQGLGFIARLIPKAGPKKRQSKARATSDEDVIPNQED